MRSIVVHVCRLIDEALFWEGYREYQISICLMVVTSLLFFCRDPFSIHKQKYILYFSIAMLYFTETIPTVSGGPQSLIQF